VYLNSVRPRIEPTKPEELSGAAFDPQLDRKMNTLSIARSLTRVVKSGQVMRCMSGYGDDHHGKTLAQTVQEHHSTPNDLPVPAGSWQEYHNKRNQAWNIMLAAGALSLAAVAILMHQTHTLYLHGTPDLKTVKIDPTSVQVRNE